jgi:hypothetical protein
MALFPSSSTGSIVSLPSVVAPTMEARLGNDRIDSGQQYLVPGSGQSYFDLTWTPWNRHSFNGRHRHILIVLVGNVVLSQYMHSLSCLTCTTANSAKGIKGIPITRAVQFGDMDNQLVGGTSLGRLAFYHVLDKRYIQRSRMASCNFAL